jgi:hypothetical protein
VPIVQFPNKNKLYYVKTKDSQNFPVHNENPKVITGFKEIESHLNEANDVLEELNRLENKKLNKMKVDHHPNIIKNNTVAEHIVASNNKTIKHEIKNNTLSIYNEINKTSKKIDELYNNPMIRQQLEKIRSTEHNIPIASFSNTTSDFMNIVSKQNFKEIEKKTKMEKLPNGPIDVDSIFLNNYL